MARGFLGTGIQQLRNKCTPPTPDEVVFVATRDAYAPHYVDDRKYFELSTFYDEFAKPWQERRLPMRHEPREGAVDVYRLWQDHNGGDRRVPGAPAADDAH
jgi:guanine deaminase